MVKPGFLKMAPKAGKKKKRRGWEGHDDDGSSSVRGAGASCSTSSSATVFAREKDPSADFLKALTPEQALSRTKHGATILCLDYPPGSTLAFDVVEWTIGSKFKGVKMIQPSTIHLLQYIPVSLSTGAAAGVAPPQSTVSFSGIKTGMFLRFQPGTVYGLQWNEADEDFRKVPATKMRALAGAVHNFELDAHLGAHTWGSPASNLWHKLTWCVTTSALESCGIALGQHIIPGEGVKADASVDGKRTTDRRNTGAQRGIAASSEQKSEPVAGGEEHSSTDEVDHEDRGSKIRHEISAGGAKGGPHGSEYPESNVEYCTPMFHSLVVPPPKQLAGVHLSEWHLDKSQQLEIILKHRRRHAPDIRPSSCASWKAPSKFSVVEHLQLSEIALVAELQISFVLLHYLQLQPALEQWKQLIALVSGCRQAVQDRTALYSEILAVLRVQLRLMPRDFFVSPLSNGSFLQPALVAMLDNCNFALTASQDHVTSDLKQRDVVGDSLRNRMSKLNSFLESRFLGWDYSFNAQEAAAEVAGQTTDIDELCAAMAELGEDAPAIVLESEPRVSASSIEQDRTETSAQSSGFKPQRMEWMLPPPSPE